MELKELKLKNYGSFAGENSIKFAPSLTLIIGNNGDGKTTLFDALKWLFDITNPEGNQPEPDRISKNLIDGLEEGSSEEVGVELLCEHQGQKITLKKYFFVSFRDGELNIPRTVNKVAYIENFRGERTLEDMHTVIQDIFPPSIQQFCLFKGEAELDVLTNNQALGGLLSRFSEVSQLDKYMTTAQKIASRADKAAMDERRRNNKDKKRFDEISEKLIAAKAKKEELEEQISLIDEDLEAKKKLFDSLKAHEEVWDEYQELNDRKTQVEEEIGSLERRTNIDPDINLLDDLWILKDFDGIFEEFENKVSFWGEKRHALELERVKEEAKIEKSVEMSKELRSRLPIHSPDASTLETLIAAERCEICGRDAKKGTPAYQHMCDRLKELRAYLAGLPKEEPKLPPLFPYDYIGEINSLYKALTGGTQADLNRRLRQVDNVMCQLNKDRKSLQEKRHESAEWQIKIQNLLITNNIKDEVTFFGPTQKLFLDSSNSIAHAYGKKEVLEGQRLQYANEINGLNNQLGDIALDDPRVVFLDFVNNVLKNLLTAFKEGREENVKQFVKKLEEKANKYFEALNAKDFHGFIKLIRNEGTDKIDIQLQDSTGQVIPLPNTAQKTSEYLAVLFAISELGHNKDDEVYPLVFDAPTSSFSAGKEGDFYDIVAQFNQQCVILTKDLLKTDGSLDLEKIEKLNCNVIRIQLKPTFVQGNLATVQTEIKEVKV
ncbi:AAA family ATPase [Parasutterella excrementihominis]|uniref:AAA family ATPase n=1 Tax=Parasutterella excrementihominis TaxID=487175 RepID=UPI002664E97E|nr:AAA family ATPase [Parasutterella excrementihominis]